MEKSIFVTGYELLIGNSKTAVVVPSKKVAKEVSTLLGFDVPTKEVKTMKILMTKTADKAVKALKL